MPNHNAKLRGDEKVVRTGDIRIAKLKDGGRRLTHPSGHEDIETPEMQASELAMLDSLMEETKLRRDQYAEEIK
jgi:hypothetical protein